MKQSLIIALDFPDLLQTETFLKQFHSEKLAVKVGMELFYQNGPSIVSFVKEQGHDVFLDLKLHDIPNTVKMAMTGLAALGADMVNVHAAGGQKMMEAAIEGLDKGTSAGKKRPLCIGVTQLTSTSQEQMNAEQNIAGSLEDSVLHYAKLTRQAGLDGVVCSTHEVKNIHERIGHEFLTVTPGIRSAGGQTHDQKRIATPEQARDFGADAIVVGRAITGAADPLRAYLDMKAAWEGISC
ncbi:orotidine-5'-phosphate decarboxylase [Peribacillus frigoritolerans]|uniref:orotidine-5'-phosphate decarboxylase n=1 Tax=Peribacillus frigoritolerans TaxID=450367 RepID=UPI0023DA0196|nr:orotidine-5'-phosphate decarboxylase [Peribacillus frigoritolerans]MDF1998626.1 orotidine-5'-phosphate decarboxylase [Peribacillus frigoritolerans]